MKNVDFWFILARFYSALYGFVKDYFGLHLRGLGFILRKIKTDRILDVNGRKLYFSHILSEAYSRSLNGRWNEPETHTFVRFILEHVKIVFVEVGANIGEILVDISANPFCEKSVAFEPNPFAVSVIEQNLELNAIKNSHVVAKALGHENTTQRMYFGSHSPSASLFSIESRNQDGENITVSTLDAEFKCSDYHGRNVVLLIDVEGYELNVVIGGADFIKNCRPLIIFEYHHETRKVFSLDQLQDVLGPDYEIFRLRQDAFLDSDVENSWNCVAIPRDSEFDSVLRARICKQ